MEMQDKEFDELFRSKLDDLEAEPSAGVWTGIESGLVNSARKKYLLPLLGIAASVLILITASILFMPHGGKTTGKNQAKNTFAKTFKPINTGSTSVGPKAIVPGPIMKNKTDETAAIINRRMKLHPTKATTIQPFGVQPKIETEQPVKADDQQELASAQSKQQDIIKPVVPDESTPLIAKQLVDEPAAVITKPVLATTRVPIISQETAPIKQKHKIRSLGDFLNVVIAKVDKRPDKIIEFSDTDDDESTITGVNLGIIKIKKEK